MKTISLNISEPVYEDFKFYAKRHDRTTSELIREAMELYRHERMRPTRSLDELRPRHVGRVLKPLEAGEGWLEEMLVNL